MQMLPTQKALLDIAGGCTSIGTPSVPFLSGALLKLVNSPTVTLNGSTTWGSVSPQIGGYDGYADGTITFDAPSTPLGGGAEAVSNNMVFRPTDSTNPQNMYGAVITDAAAANVLFAAPFDQVPLPMQNALDQIQCTFRFNPQILGGLMIVLA